MHFYLFYTNKCFGVHFWLIWLLCISNSGRNRWSGLTQYCFQFAAEGKVWFFSCICCIFGSCYACFFYNFCIGWFLSFVLLLSTIGFKFNLHGPRWHSIVNSWWAPYRTCLLWGFCFLDVKGFLNIKKKSNFG